MAIDHTLAVRRAVITRLKEYGPLTSLISATRIKGDFVPANIEWPFIRYESATAPWAASRMDGSAIDVSLHLFWNGPGTDQVLAAGAAAVEALTLGWNPSGLVEAEWMGAVGPRNDTPGGETAKWHLIERFAVTWVTVSP